jgi:ElaB/YqjD/DUF883 family membrane-anchored ribosome-binding protein
MTENQPAVGEKVPHGEPKDPAEIAEIEADIDQTRNAITGDLRTLAERLSPENLKQEAKEVMTEAKNAAVETMHEAKNVATSTFREVKDSALDSVSAKVDEIRADVRAVERDAVGFMRDNALPLALIGIGVAWFVANGRNRDRRWEGDYAARGHGRWRYPESDGAGPLDDVRDGLSRAAGTTREYGSRAKDRARGWVEGAWQDVNEVAGQVRDFAEREVQQVRGVARDASAELRRATWRARDVAGRELRQAREFTRRTTDTHPLAVAAGAAAAGLFVGLVIPETQRENELLGPERERLLSDAKGALSDAKGAARDLAHTAKDAARGLENSLSGSTG